MRKKLKKYYLIQNEAGNRYYGAFPLGQEGKLAAEAYVRMLEKKHKEERFNVVEA